MQALHKSTRFLGKRKKKGNTANQNSRNHYTNNSEKDRQAKKQTNWKLIIKGKDHIMGKSLKCGFTKERNLHISLVL